MENSQVINILISVAVVILCIRFFPQIKGVAKRFFEDYWGTLLFVVILGIILILTGY
jgi:putative effector of murein hydrolase